MATTDHTNGVSLSDAAWADDVDCSAYSVLSSVAGTNTITATGPATYSYAATRPPVWFIPAVTNTGATTINVTPSGGAALGAKNIFWNGVALVGDELRANIPVAIIYDGTQFNIVANGFNAPFLDTHAVVEGGTDRTKKVRFEVDGLTTATTRVLTVQDQDMTLGLVSGTEVASTSGTSIDFTSIPAWVKEIVIEFVGVSTNGTDDWMIQIGDAGGVETSGYLGACGTILSASASNSNFTAGFGLAKPGTAAAVIHGRYVLSLEDSTQFTWVGSGIVSESNQAQTHCGSGSKSLSATLDRVRITTTGGTNTFDAGAINILYQ